MLVKSEEVLLYENPTPTGDSKKSKFASSNPKIYNKGIVFIDIAQFNRNYLVNWYNL